MTLAAVLLSLGTFFFSALGIFAERDFFLMLGLVACVAGCGAFAFYLWEQGVTGEATDALVANFMCLLLLSLYAISCQFEGWREHGLASGEEEDGVVEEEEEEEAAPAVREKADNEQQKPAIELPRKRK